MNNRFLKLLQLSLTTIDLIAINAIFFTAEYLFHARGMIVPTMEYVYFGFSLNAIWVVVTLILNIYHEKNIVSFESFSKVSAKAFFYFILIIITELFFFRFLLLSRLFIIVVISSLPVAFLFNRLLYLLICQYFKTTSLVTSKVIVVGYNLLSKKLVEYLAEDRINKKVVGYCEEYENVNELSRYPILSDINGTLSACKEHGVTEIYSTISPEHNPGLYKLIQYADQNCIRFKIVPDLALFINRSMHVDYIKEMPVLSLRKEPLVDLGNRAKKRIFDIVVSIFTLIFILSWLLPILALLVKLTSRGPIFFAQLRSGKDNKQFYCYKFRSMKKNNEQNSKQAARNDSRITWFGKFLRRTSLDELPQFWNVLCGDMSIIGPRPHMLKHTDEYSALIGEYMVRQFLKPGISGWAQVNGYRGETQTVDQMEGRVQHDLWYLENWSLLLDIKIIFLTCLLAIKGDKHAF